MSFANTLRAAGNNTLGPNGATNISTTGRGVMNLNNKLLPGLHRRDCGGVFRKAIEEINHNHDPEAMMRLVITIINSVISARVGEGARRIFYRLLTPTLYNAGYKQPVLDMIKFVPDIGYYNDGPILFRRLTRRLPSRSRPPRTTSLTSSTMTLSSAELPVALSPRLSGTLLP